MQLGARSRWAHDQPLAVAVSGASYFAGFHLEARPVDRCRAICVLQRYATTARMSYDADPLQGSVTKCIGSIAMNTITYIMNMVVVGGFLPRFFGPR